MEKEQIQERIKEIEAAMQQPDFWSDKNDAQALIKELHDLKAEAEGGNAYDRRGSIVSLVAGAGGDDAEDFARMLFEMYRKYFEKRGWSARILHENKNDHGGFRNMSIEVGGNPSTRSARSGQVLSTSKGECTGVYFDPATAGSLTMAINKFLDLEKKDYFDPKFIRQHAQKFSKERFKREILKFVESKIR